MDTSRLKDLAVSETGFLFDPYTGLTFSVNATGRFILEKLRGGVEIDHVADELRKAFDHGEHDDPVRDVREFVLLLRDAGILPREEQR